jgi:diguanylate cyclase (GGDEF)-like protein/PAS domain S-box-containing protein
VLDLAGRVAAAAGWARRVWLAAGATATGVGIWAKLIQCGGMWAVRFRASQVAISSEHAVHVSPLGAAVIGLASLQLLILAAIAAFLDRNRTTRKTAGGPSHDGEAHFRMLTEAIPQIVWTAGPDGKTDYINQRWYEMTGTTEAQSLGGGWVEVIHPDDRAVCLDNWQNALRAGNTFEVEYRLRDRTQGYRWYLDRAVPMRDAEGSIIKWFGTCTDIEDQKHNQQILEEQIKERAEELAETSARLQEEMFEKDLARRQLDEQNDEMVRQLSDRSQRATMLAKMGELLQSCVSNDEVFTAALGFAPKIFPTQRGAFALLNSGRNLAEFSSSWHDCCLPVSVFEPVDCWALRTGHPHLVVAGDPTAPCAHARGIHNTYLCVPILAQGEALGIVHFQATDDAPILADAEISLKTTFASQVGLSVANIRLRDALRTQSIRDPLTGLYNRRYLGEMLERETRRAVRAEHGLGILMLDLDHFKKFNDTYGHDAGDTVLRETASFLTKSVRAEDIVCRYGGEEFVVILPMADLSASQARAERIRSHIRELAVLHQGQSVGPVTVSVGVAELPNHGTAPKELLEAADAALYRAKREGRNRVMVADPPQPGQRVVAAGAE